MAAPKVFIDIGHGGSDPGAVANGLIEKDVNLVTGIALNAELVRHGVETMLSRSDDTDTSLATTCRMVNTFKPNYAVSLHHNAGGGDGCEVFYHHGGGKGKKLATNIAEELKAIGQNLRLGDSGEYDGLKTKKNSSGKDYYMFIRETTPPAVIVEVAFLDHAKDHEFVDTEEEQKRNGVAIAKGILKELGIACKAEEPEKEEPAADTSGVTVTLPVLKKGSKGAQVKALQALLKGLGYSLGIWGADGDFGAQTVKVVQQYQKKQGLEADGIVGKATWSALLGI